MSFVDFFRRATGDSADQSGFDPYPYQRRLAETEWEAWPTILDVPTGLGKTAAVVLGWLWRRHQEPNSVPRRLAYTLPMRSLVTQTVGVAKTWLDHLDEDSTDVHLLMGGETETSWAENPETPAIIVGTQDMLLSRALMRGYGMSRYEWPIHYGLLHNDAFWVFDETQLMGVGVETSAQLHSFRKEWGTAAPTDSLWMSATVGEDALDTVDHDEPNDGWPTHTIDQDDRGRADVERRLNADKSVGFLDAEIPNSTSNTNLGNYVSSLADEISEEHNEHDGLTLVVMNRVNRAQQLFSELRDKEDDANAQLDPLLLHSRFRKHERDRLEDELLRASEDASHRIVVATQVVEAGLDISSKLMVTELAPWASIVQRVGRCNRSGEYDHARVLVADAESGEKAARPYEPEPLARAREAVGDIEQANPRSLEGIDVDTDRPFYHVLRRRDALDLFDTTPDLAGNDLDVKRYVRDVDESDVQVYWREVEDDAPSEDVSRPDRDELCSVPCFGSNGIREFIDDAEAGWRWDPLEDMWVEADEPIPGHIILIDAQSGGYDPDIGWVGDDSSAEVQDLELGDTPHSSYSGDERSFTGQWVQLNDHLAHVAHTARNLAEELGLENTLDVDGIDPVALLRDAAAWHDVGKAHDAFQSMLLEPTEREDGPAPPDDPDALYAKSNHRAGSPGRRYFRHELASALAILAERNADESNADLHTNLLAYIVAGHHGRVRLSIRSMPDEQTPQDDPDRLVARGVWDGDELPAVSVPGVETSFEQDGVTLDLGVMELGEGSWLERTLDLRDHDEIGPFRLAYLESLLRIADRRASRREANTEQD